LADKFSILFLSSSVIKPSLIKSSGIDIFIYW
jgi:hypothetical protein